MNKNLIYLFLLFLSQLKANRPPPLIFAIHEHELIADADFQAYEKDIKDALEMLRTCIPGLLHASHLKGIKGERIHKYAILWIFANKQALEDNFDTPDKPKWPFEWLYYENHILAKYLTCHPDMINFTDYSVINSSNFEDFL